MKPPDIWPPDSMGAPERDETTDLGSHLWGLTYNVEAWHAALELYKFAKSPPDSVKRRMAWKWKWIAIHECVMQLSYLDERLKVIRKHKMRGCPTVRTLYDSSAYKRSGRLLEEYFPDGELLRHAVAHMGEVDSIGGPHTPPNIGYALFRITDEDRFEAPYQGSVYSLDISDGTLAKIKEVVATFFSAFEPVAQEFERLGRSA